MSKMIRVPIWILIAFGLLVSGSGCVNDTIKLRNANTVAPAARVKWEAIAPREKKWLGLTWSGLVVEGELAYLYGDDNQNVAAGRQVGLGGTTLSGPTRVRTRANVIDVTGGVRTGLEFLDIFRLEPFVGLELASVDLEIESASGQASERTTGFGSFIGMRAGLQPHEFVELYGRASVGALAHKNQGTLTTKMELGARLLPLDHFGLFAAYRWSRFREGRDPSDSDSDLEFRGPILGLELRF